MISRDERIVSLGHQLEKTAVNVDAIAAGPKVKHPMPVEFCKTPDTFGLEIFEQLRPVVVVSLAEQLHQPLPLAARGRLLQGHFEQRRVPPAHFVVAVIAEHARIIAQRQNLVARDLIHPRDDVRVPHVQPGHAASHADGQHRNESHVRVAALPQSRIIAPSAYGGEVPRLKPLQRGPGPAV